MSASCPHVPCPYRERVRRAIECYRTQQAEIASQQAEIAHLREILARHERLGVRQYREFAAGHSFVGTIIWADNVGLRRAVEQLHARIRQQATGIASLKQLLRAQEVRA